MRSDAGRISPTTYTTFEQDSVLVNRGQCEICLDVAKDTGTHSAADMTDQRASLCHVHAIYRFATQARQRRPSQRIHPQKNEASYRRFCLHSVGIHCCNEGFMTSPRTRTHTIAFVTHIQHRCNHNLERRRGYGSCSRVYLTLL